MRRVVIDTNVLISGVILGNSLPGHVIELVWSNEVHLYSLATYSELLEVISRPKFQRYVTQSRRDEFILKFRNYSELIAVQTSIGICRDVRDNKFLELAIDGQADFLITGDEDLLAHDPFHSTRIITPANFLALVGE